MKASKSFQNKITWYSFAFSLLVIWIHAYNAELFLGAAAPGSLAMRVEQFLGEKIGQIAVPGFFMISGYLFFRGFTWDQLQGKWERRIRSVLVPYILWNAIYYVGYLAASRLPWLDQTVGKGVIPCNLTEIVDALLHYKYNPVFWYLYQLIILILLAPVIYAVLKNVWGSLIWFVILLLLIIGKIDLPYVNEDALLYYTAAAKMAISCRWLVEGIRRKKTLLEKEIFSNSEKDTFEKDERRLEPEKNRFEKAAGSSDYQKDTYKKWKWQLPQLSMMEYGIIFLAAAVLAGEIGFRFAIPAGLVLCRLFAVAGVWFLIPAKRLPEAGDMAHHNFFLYATHFAMVRLLNKSVARLLSLSDLPVWMQNLIPLLLYLIMPVLVLGIVLLLIQILKRYFPGLCRVLNGAR